MPLTFLGMDRVPWAAVPLAVVGSIYAVCGAAGLVVGAIHGVVVVRLVDRRSRPAGREP
jgi:hypothetical protein